MKGILLVCCATLAAVLFLLNFVVANHPQQKRNNKMSDEEWPKYYETETGKFLTLDQVMNKWMLVHPIIFVGEYHDHIWGHKIEYHLLQQLYANLTRVSTQQKLHFAVSLEMFERDTQAWVSGYLNAQMSESCFLDNSRPWPNYNTDYKPLVEFVKQQQPTSLSKNKLKVQRPVSSTVLASNIPRRYAAFVASGKDEEIFAMPDVERSYMAPEILAPHDQYYKNFYDLMKPSGWDDAKIERYYRAQCIKDDTMAMSIAQFFNQTFPPLQSSDSDVDTRVISFSGSFHVDYHLGLVSKVRNLLPTINTMLMSMVPVDPSEPIKPEQYKTLADIVVFAPQNPQQ